MPKSTKTTKPSWKHGKWGSQPKLQKALLELIWGTCYTQSLPHLYGPFGALSTRERSLMARWAVCGLGLLCQMAFRVGQVLAEGFAGRPLIHKSDLKVLLRWLDVSHQMCHRPGVLKSEEDFMRHLFSACGARVGVFAKECVVLPCQQIFHVDMSLFRPVQKVKHRGKKKKSWVIKASAVTCGIEMTWKVLFCWGKK